jgi:hypothetical protein
MISVPLKAMPPPPLGVQPIPLCATFPLMVLLLIVSVPLL